MTEASIPGKASCSVARACELGVSGRRGSSVAVRPAFGAGVAGADGGSAVFKAAEGAGDVGLSIDSGTASTVGARGAAAAEVSPSYVSDISIGRSFDFYLSYLLILYRLFSRHFWKLC